MTPRQPHGGGTILLWGPSPPLEQLVQARARISLPFTWADADAPASVWAPRQVVGDQAEKALAELARLLQPWPVEWLSSGNLALPPGATAEAVIRAASHVASRARGRVMLLTDQAPWTDPIGVAAVKARSAGGGAFSLQVVESRIGGGAGAYALATTPLDRLQAVMLRLLAPGGCPWDREQTHKTLRPYVIEEAAEVLEAIEQGRQDKLVDELGDLLLQIAFHAALAAERGDFDLSRVTAAIEGKMLHRHPHVFGDWQVTGAADVLRNWDLLKAEESAAAGELGESRLWRPLRKAAVRVSLAALRAAFAAAGGDASAYSEARAALGREVDRLSEEAAGAGGQC